MDVDGAWYIGLHHVVLWNESYVFHIVIVVVVLTY